MKRRPVIALLLLATLSGLLALWWMSGISTEPPPSALAQLTPPPAPRLHKMQRPADADELIRAPRAAPPPPTARPAPAVRLPVPSEPGVSELLVRVVDDHGLAVPSAGLNLAGNCGPRNLRVSQGERKIELPSGPCQLFAWRRDGALRALSGAVDIELVPGATHTARLVIPSQRTGGLGVQIERVANGMRVVRVVPGSPADDAGLNRGDLITQVDGIPANLLTLEDFIAVMTGPEGSEVNFVVQYGDVDIQEPLVVTRAFLEG